MGRRLELAEVSWRDGRLWSERFGDVYGSMGLAEARHVMLAGAGLPGRWKDRSAEWPEGRFVVGELGFGAGVNFLAAWEAWDRVGQHRKSSGGLGRLRYVAVEGYPVSREVLREAMERTAAEAAEPYREAMRERGRRLVAAWPLAFESGTRLVVGFGDVELVVLWGAVDKVFEGWDEADGVDAWFLDGFSPSRNPRMWEESVLRAVGERSRRGTRVATYTVAGAVRSGLADAGFAVRKRAGIGKKRQVLTGVWEGDERGGGLTAAEAAVPRLGETARVLVVGAGIAGCAVVAALVAGGLDPARVRVWDPGGVASGASGNAAGTVQPKMGDPERSKTVAWYREAHAAMAAWLEAEDESVGWRSGALHLGVNERQAGRLAAAAAAGLGRWIGPEEASDRLGVGLERGGLWVDGAWVVRPRVVCERWLGEAGVGVEKRGAGSLEEALAAAGEGGLVVLANGDGVLGGEALVEGLGRVAGQVSGWRLGGGPWLRGVLCYGGYALPGIDCVAWLGATYDHHSGRSGVSDSDDAANRARLGASCGEVERLLPGVGAVADVSRAGVRVTTRDRLPVVGWLGRGVGDGRVYASLGHGSRGVTGAWLSARRVVAAMGL